MSILAAGGGERRKGGAFSARVLVYSISDKYERGPRVAAAAVVGIRVFVRPFPAWRCAMVVEIFRGESFHAYLRWGCVAGS